MNRYKFSILFIIATSRKRKNNTAPLMCRISLNKDRKTFSTGQFVNPKHWNSKQQLVKPPEPECDFINTQLSLIKTKINKAFLLLQVREDGFTLEDIYVLYKGKKTQKEYNVIDYFDAYLKKLKTLIGIDIKQVTWNKFDYVKNDIKSFIKWKFKTNDFSLNKIEPNFLTELEYYLKVEQKLKQVTINKKIQRFRKVIKVAVADGFLVKDPFILYKTKTVRNDIVFLSPEELEKLEKHKFVQPRLQFVKDLFVFSCYTGLPYRELMELNSSHIIMGFDGNLWIKIKREKTSKQLSIPLLPKALSILKNYQNDGDMIFPKISNQKYNSYLKEIAGIVSIDKKLTTHMARRTFASTVLLYNDVPMEIVSELLGHSNMKITQDSYGKVVQKKISLEIERLKKNNSNFNVKKSM